MAGNWTPNGIPGSTDSAAITATGNYTVTVGGAESIGTLTLGASTADGTVQTLTVSSTLTVNNSSSGTAQGTLSVTGGTLTGGGSILLAGKFNWTAGRGLLICRCNSLKCGTVRPAQALSFWKAGN